MIGLKGPSCRKVEVFRLFLGELGQLHADLAEVEGGDLLLLLLF